MLLFGYRKENHRDKDADGGSLKTQASSSAGGGGNSGKAASEKQMVEEEGEEEEKETTDEQQEKDVNPPVSRGITTSCAGHCCVCGPKPKL